MTMPAPSRSIDVALAEFNTLRAEILARTAAQATLASVGLTASGVAVGFALSDKGVSEVAIVVPFFAAAIIVAYVFESFRIIMVGGYVRDVLWPYLQSQTSASVPSWESHRLVVSRASTWGLGERLMVVVFLALGILLSVVTPNVPTLLRVAALVIVIAAAALGMVLVRIATQKERASVHESVS